jgi:hypothetical protein
MKPTILLHVLSIIIIIHALHLILKNKTSKICCDNKETFLPRLSTILDEKPDNLIINVPTILFNPQIEDQIMNIKNIIINTQNSEEITNNTTSLTTTDAFSFSHNEKNNKSLLFLSPLTYERGFMFIKPLELQTKTIFEDDVVIGYYNSIDKSIIQLIYSSMKDRYITPQYILKKIPQDMKISKNTYTKLGLDNICIFTSIHDNSLYLRDYIVNEFKFDVVDYADRLDVFKLNVITPFTKIKTADFSTIFSQLKGQYLPRSIITFDIILIGSKAITKRNVSVELQKILKIVNKPDAINFYHIHFDVFPEAKQSANKLNEFTQIRSELQILEQFGDTLKKLHIFRFNTNVIGFYDSFNNTFLVNGTSIHDIPLKNKSQVILENQTRVEENGKYQVTKLDKKQTVLSKMQVPKLTIQTNEFEPGYKCTDPNIKSKSLCETPFQPSGELKAKKTYWDKPCENHSDCPFYQKNRNYQNYRGGCIDGRCEMPLGVKNVSFRKYEKSTQPLCHNCKDPLSSFCCNEQENKSVYPTLKSPDYAFELDSFERLRYKS